MPYKSTKSLIPCQNVNGLRKVKILYINNKFQQSEAEKLDVDSSDARSPKQEIVAAKNTHASHLML